MSGIRTNAESHDSDPLLWLAEAGILDKDDLATCCCQQWYEQHHELPFLEELVGAVKKRFNVTISIPSAGRGRRLFKSLLDFRDTEPPS